MTTIKEYKAMMEGATDAPWSYIHENYAIYGAPDSRGAQGRIAEIDITNNHNEDAQFIAASRNIAPDLIRVIELADEALNSVVDDYDEKGHGAVLVKALSEIRKLKGE